MMATNQRTGGLRGPAGLAEPASAGRSRVTVARSARVLAARARPARSSSSSRVSRPSPAWRLSCWRVASRSESETRSSPSGTGDCSGLVLAPPSPWPPVLIVPRPAGGASTRRTAGLGGIMLPMRLSARADYALRAAIELASATDSHVTADKIARSQQIPGRFLETILPQLRRAGLIRSQRGPEGGFWLARPANEISLADIIRAIDGPLLGVRGERPENVTYPGAAEPLQSVWIALRANERAILDEVTLEHIVTGELPLSIRSLTDDPKAWV